MDQSLEKLYLRIRGRAEACTESAFCRISNRRPVYSEYMVQGRIQEFLKGGGGQGPRKGRRVGIFKLTSKRSLSGVNPPPTSLAPPLG